MNFLNAYYTVIDTNQFSVSGAQGSAFAKTIADDFNPLHNADAKRFCVPGDLLFAIAIKQYGLHQHMAFKFLELVGADTPLTYPPQITGSAATQVQIMDDKDKPVLDVEYTGGSSNNTRQIEQLIKSYVIFSGQNFPHILLPLMRQHDVMINPNRPLVIYESMSLEFDRLEFDSLNINLEKTTLSVDGKRGYAKLYFSLNSEARVIGSGVKNLLLSGLRQYDELAINQLCEEYLASKSA